MNMKLEAAVLPVADSDRSKSFYQGLGWRLDADIQPNDNYRLVQFTPPDSPASVQFGKGITPMEPGSVQDLLLVVEDIGAARNDLISHGADVSDVWHGPGLGNVKGREPGPDPGHHSYRSFAKFADPDGNTFLLQEVTERLPGRVWQEDIGSLADLLHETSEHHGVFEAAAPAHNWWDWYAAYLSAREDGSSPGQAAEAAGRYMADAKHIVIDQSR